MNKKQILILVATVVVAILLGSGVGFLYANKTTPKLDKATLEQEMKQKLTQEAEELSKQCGKASGEENLLKLEQEYWVSLCCSVL